MAFLAIFRAILAEKWPYRPCNAGYGHFGGRQSEPALRLLQRTDKQEEEAQQNEQEVDDFAPQVFFVEEEGAA